MNKQIASRRHSLHASLRGMALAGMVAAIGFVAVPAAQAQSTAGRIFGKAPAGESVSAKNDTIGYDRTVPVDEEGRFRLPALQPGRYDVTLIVAGKATERHVGVPVAVGRGTNVNFSCAPDNCAAK